MGNARAKEIYEACVPVHYPIPTEGSSSQYALIFHIYDC